MLLVSSILPTIWWSRILPDSDSSASPGRAPQSANSQKRGFVSTTLFSHVSPQVHILRRQRSLRNCANTEFTFVSFSLDNGWLSLPQASTMDKWPVMQVQISYDTVSNDASSNSIWHCVNASNDGSIGQSHRGRFLNSERNIAFPLIATADRVSPEKLAAGTLCSFTKAKWCFTVSHKKNWTGKWFF